MNMVQYIGLISAVVAAFGGLGLSLRTAAQNRLDNSVSRKRAAEADSIAVDTARDLIQQVREETNHRINDLSQQVAELRGRLAGALEQRDRFREEAENLHRENRELKTQAHDLKARVETLEARLREVTEALMRERDRRRAGKPPATGDLPTS